MSLIYLEDNFITREQSRYIINYYKTHLDSVKQYDFNYPLSILNTTDYSLKTISDRILSICKRFKNDVGLDNLEIVKWPVKSHMKFHKDTGEDSFSGTLIYDTYIGNGDEKVFGFNSGYLTNYSVNCGVGGVPTVDIAVGQGILHQFYVMGLETGVFPLLIFMGVGAMTDFGPLLANPKTLLLGAAAQFGIFSTLLGALFLTDIGWFDFSLQQAAAIGIIGGADGPTAIYVAGILAPEILGAIAVAAYSYMALVPIIQPPIMRLLTTEAERKVVMKQLRPVSKLERILFPLTVLALCILFLPTAAPLIGMFTFGNLLRESGVVDRLNHAAQNEIINIVTILLGLAVGSKLQGDHFLNLETIGILLLGAIAFSIGTAAGLLLGKLLHRITGGKINPLIGAAGVSAVPMAARVVNKVGLEADHHNFLLMHAMGPNVAGVLGSAVAAGVLLVLVGH